MGLRPRTSWGAYCAPQTYLIAVGDQLLEEEEKREAKERGKKSRGGKGKREGKGDPHATAEPGLLRALLSHCRK